jgi:hypothetical protein
MTRSRATACIALHAGAIPHQPGIAALAAHLALAFAVIVGPSSRPVRCDRDHAIIAFTDRAIAFFPQEIAFFQKKTTSVRLC